MCGGGKEQAVCKVTATFKGLSGTDGLKGSEAGTAPLTSPLNGVQLEERQSLYQKLLRRREVKNPC